MDKKCAKCGKILFGDDPNCWYCNEPVGGPGGGGESRDAFQGFASPSFVTDDHDVTCPSCTKSTDSRRPTCEWCGASLTGEDSAPPPSGKNRKHQKAQPAPPPVAPPPAAPPTPEPAHEELQRSTPKSVSGPPVPAQGGSEAKAWITIIAIAAVAIPIFLFARRKEDRSRRERSAQHRKHRKTSSRYRHSMQVARKPRYDDAKKRMDQARKDLQNSPAQKAQEQDFADEKGCFVLKKAGACERWAKRHEGKRYTDKKLFKRVIEARVAACTKKYTESCKALSQYVRTDVSSMTPAQKRHYYTLACEMGSHLYSCDRVAFMELQGKGGPEDLTAARRHLGGACSRDVFYCWDEGEVMEVAAWHSLGKGHPMAAEDQVWFGKIFVKHATSSFADEVTKLKAAAITKMEKAIPLGYYLPLKQLEAKTWYPKKPKADRYAQVKVRLVNDAAVATRVELTMSYGLKKGEALKGRVRSHRVCYPVDRKTRQCTVTSRDAKGGITSVLTLDLPPFTSRVALFELDTSKFFSKPPLMESFVLTRAVISWPRGKKGPRPDKKQLLALKGPYAPIKAIYAASCEHNRKNRPNDLLCRFLKQPGKHSKEDLFVFCNERKTGEAFVDGACYRLKDRFGVDVWKTNQ